MSNLTNKLRETIHTEVKGIDPEEYPNIFARSSTKQGYTDLEEQIILIMVNQQIGVGSAINLIENECL